MVLDKAIKGDNMKARKCKVSKDFKNLNGFYAKKGAEGHVVSVDRNYYTVLFSKESLPLVKSNHSTGDTLEIPVNHLSIEVDWSEIK